jgi:predicted regulator of Ras-like GTPase activity (Roadblock/LC7/MglB family)
MDPGVRLTAPIQPNGHRGGSMTNSNGAGVHSDAGRNRSAWLDRILAELVGQVPEIEAAAVVSFDGLPMAAALPVDMDEDRVAAMSAALLSLGERAAEGLGRGELSQVYVEGENGNVFLVSADDEAVLVAVTAKGAKVGMMLFEIRRAAAALGDVLRVDATWNTPEATDHVDASSYLPAVPLTPTSWIEQRGSLGTNGGTPAAAADVTSWS